MKPLERIKQKVLMGAPLREGEDIIIAKTFKIGKLLFCWWGFSQWYKWRWNITRIDLGCLSINGLKSKRWIILAWLIKPMRWYYHKYYSNKPNP